LSIANKPALVRSSRVAILVLAWAGFVGFKLSEALSGTPIMWQDTELYVKVAHAGWFSSGLWTGERAPLVPVLWKLTGTPTSFVVVQTVFSILCWTALAIVVTRVVAAGWWRLVAFVAVLGLATTAPVRLWDHSVLSETMALSWLALLTTVLLLVVRRPTWPRVIAVGLSALGFAATRDTDVFTPLVLGLVLAACAVGRRFRVRWRLVAVAGALLAGAALPLALGMASDRSNLNVRNNYYVRVFPYESRVAWFAGQGMPQQRMIDELASAQQTSPGQMPVVAPDMNDPAYAPLYRWIRSHGAVTYLEWLGTHPRYVITAPFDRLPEAFNNADGQLSFYAGGAASTEPLDKLFAGRWWYAMAVAAIALVTAGPRARHPATGVAPVGPAGGGRRPLGPGRLARRRTGSYAAHRRGRCPGPPSDDNRLTDLTADVVAPICAEAPPGAPGLKSLVQPCPPCG